MEIGGGTPAMFTRLRRPLTRRGKTSAAGQAAQAVVGLLRAGPGRRALADGYSARCYGFLGDIAGQIAASAAVSPEMVKGYAAAFAEAGCDELIFVPTSSSLEQVGLLAEAVS